MPDFLKNTFFSLNYDLSFIVLLSFYLAVLTIYFRYVSNKISKNYAVIHKSTLFKYLLIFIGLIICFSILIYGTFFKKLELTKNNSVDCFLINLFFFTTVVLIVLFIIQFIQDLIKTYKDKRDYQEQAKMATDPPLERDKINCESNKEKKNTRKSSKNIKE